MAPIVPDPDAIKSFRTAAAFEAWMRTHHARETEIWLRVYKKGSGVPTVAISEALDVALCWGWIDGIRKSLDEQSYLQRYSPRTPRSPWSQINRDHVARLIAAGRMTPHGQRQIDLARADGRWDAAYAPIRARAPRRSPKTCGWPSSQPSRARDLSHAGQVQPLRPAFRTNTMKTAAGRARKIAALVAMLERGETIVPEPRRRTP